jgi:hypothetical protein
MNRLQSLSLILVAACAFVPHLEAQGRGESGVSLYQPAFAVPANYSIAKPGELTMQVNIWGLVNHPGRYEVSITTDLIQLVSYAGGPVVDARLDAVKVTRFLKTDNGISKSEIIVNLEDLYRINDSSIILQPGDTIFIDRTGWSSFRDVLSVVTTVAVVAATVTTVYYNTHH